MGLFSTAEERGRLAKFKNTWVFNKEGKTVPLSSWSKNFITKNFTSGELMFVLRTIFGSFFCFLHFGFLEKTLSFFFVLSFAFPFQKKRERKRSYCFQKFSCPCIIFVSNILSCLTSSLNQISVEQCQNEI